MNHSINNLLWITLFAVLYISSVNGLCGASSPIAEICQCGIESTCLGNNPGFDGCGCYWVGATPTVGTCSDKTCDPTIDPTIDPTSDPTVDPTIDPTQMPTIPTSNPSTAPTASTGAPAAGSVVPTSASLAPSVAEGGT
eukprot:243634_1